MAFSASALNSRITRGNLLPSSACRLVMYIERDSRKTTPGKEQQGGNEYLSTCLGLLIRHIVQELPRVLGKWEPRPQAPCCLLPVTWLAGFASSLVSLACYCRRVQGRFFSNVQFRDPPVPHLLS